MELASYFDKGKTKAIVDWYHHEIQKLGHSLMRRRVNCVLIMLGLGSIVRSKQTKNKYTSICNEKTRNASHFKKKTEILYKSFSILGRQLSFG